MTIEEFDGFCGALPGASFVVQWGGAHVWKVGSKVFAIGFPAQPEPGFTFKVSPMAFDMLKDQPGVRPAPYLASRGLKWAQHYARPGLGDEELRAYLVRSHAIVVEGLPRRLRQTVLGDGAADPGIKPLDGRSPAPGGARRR